MTAGGVIRPIPRPPLVVGHLLVPKHCLYFAVSQRIPPSFRGGNSDAKEMYLCHCLCGLSGCLRLSNPTPATPPPPPAVPHLFGETPSASDAWDSSGINEALPCCGGHCRGPTGLNPWPFSVDNTVGGSVLYHSIPSFHGSKPVKQLFGFGASAPHLTPTRLALEDVEGASPVCPIIGCQQSSGPPAHIQFLTHVSAHTLRAPDPRVKLVLPGSAVCQRSRRNRLWVL